MTTYSSWSVGQLITAAHLQELVDAENGTSVAISTFSGTGVGAGTVTPTCTKVGNRVYLSGLITDSSPPISGTIATLPAGYRPAQQQIAICAGDGTTFCKLTIATAGTVVFTALGGTAPASVSLDGISFVGA